MRRGWEGPKVDGKRNTADGLLDTKGLEEVFPAPFRHHRPGLDIIWSDDTSPAWDDIVGQDTSLSVS